jgi:polynucleotide 5'-kinase involved in rRNA processing
LLVPDAKRRERHNTEKEERVKYFKNGNLRNFEVQGDNTIKGRLLNYEAHQHEELRNQLVKEIVLTEKLKFPKNMIIKNIKEKTKRIRKTKSGKGEKLITTNCGNDQGPS